MMKAAYGDMEKAFGQIGGFAGLLLTRRVESRVGL